jgi:hypothetical protein
MLIETRGQAGYIIGLDLSPLFVLAKNALPKSLTHFANTNSGFFMSYILELLKQLLNFLQFDPDKEPDLCEPLEHST